MPRLTRASRSQEATLKKMLCAVALAVASVGLAAPPAQAADTPRCVTKVEYRKVHDDMRRWRVHRIFDIRGRRVAIARRNGFTAEVRSYRTCRRGSAVSVTYGNGRVDSKFAVWRKRGR